MKLAVLAITLLAGLTACGHSEAKYNSTRALADKIQCSNYTKRATLRFYSDATCLVSEHDVHLYWFPHDGAAEGFMAASRGAGFVWGPNWLVMCSVAADCTSIQKLSGGQITTSTGHA
jgi:hypothetical protein